MHSRSANAFSGHAATAIRARGSARRRSIALPCKAPLLLVAFLVLCAGVTYTTRARAQAVFDPAASATLDDPPATSKGGAPTAFTPPTVQNLNNGYSLVSMSYTFTAAAGDVGNKV
jgi:hypothetical protein